MDVTPFALFVSASERGEEVGVVFEDVEVGEGVDVGVEVEIEVQTVEELDRVGAWMGVGVVVVVVVDRESLDCLAWKSSLIRLPTLKCVSLRETFLCLKKKTKNRRKKPRGGDGERARKKE